MQLTSTAGASAATQAVTTLDEQTAPAADSTERPLTTADRCDVCDAQAYIRVAMLAGELFFYGHYACKYADKLKKVALLFQDETSSLTAGSRRRRPAGPADNPTNVDLFIEVGTTIHRISQFFSTGYRIPSFPRF